MARGAGVACSHVSGRLVQSGGLLALRGSAHRAFSLDDLGGAGENRGRDRQPERSGGLEIDDQFECGRLLDRQIGRFGALQDFSGINTDLAIHASTAGPVALPIVRKANIWGIPILCCPLLRHFAGWRGYQFFGRNYQAEMT